MKFEYQENVFDSRIPSLVIPVSEVLKAKAYENDEKAHAEFAMFQQCLRIYTSYYGDCVTVSSRVFGDFCKQIGKSGSLIISCVDEAEGPAFLFRVVSNGGERTIHVELTRAVARRI